MRVGKRQNSMEIKVVVNLHPYFPLLFWKDFFIFLHWKSLTLGSTQIGVFEEHATSVNPEVLWNQEDFPQLTNSKERREKTEKPNILWHPGCFRRFLVQRLGAWYSIWILKVGAKLKGCNGYRRPSMLGIRWSMLNFGCACVGCVYHRPYTHPCVVHPLTHTQTKWPPHMLWAHHSMPGHRVRPVEVQPFLLKKIGIQ